MGAHHEDTTSTAPVASLQAPIDVFAFVQALLLAASDPKAAGARLRSLKEHTAAILETKAALASALQEHDQRIVESEAKLAAQQKKIDEGWEQLQEAHRKWNNRLELIEGRIKELSEIETAQETEILPGGLTRRRERAALRDPHFETQRTA
jgi:predicted  nucleic acid-binding Zn-ribbon protein